VLGDWGVKGKGKQIAVANEMIRQSKLSNLSFIVTIGDNFYEDGVAGIDDEHWKLSYENVYKELTRRYPWYVTLGNRDYRGNVEAQLNYHSVNPNWILPDRYYTFTKELGGNQKVRFIIIDSNPYVSSYYSDPLYKKTISQDTGKQSMWIDSVLATSKEEWKIMVGHHPLYYANAARPDTFTLFRVVKPLIEKYKVQVYISGHIHNMQYNYPTTGTTGYILSGNGAIPNPAAPKSDYTLFSSDVPSFTRCTIENNTFNFQFIDSTGSVIYANSIKR
jgi:predicted MPP superfamily phosphohydrolase